MIYHNQILLALFTGSVFSAVCAVAQEEVVPLPQAHAHNDYEHTNPLLDALSHGFCSVEADIFLVDEKLLVGHYRWQLNSSRTLEELYLKPLSRRVAKQNGKVYKDGPLFTLLVDIKGNGNATYPILNSLLRKYESMLSGLRKGKYEYRAVQVVVSGSCPRTLIAKDASRLVSIDGRLGDLDSDDAADLIPLISARWGSVFKWRGRTKVTNDELKKLQDIVDAAHSKKRRVRFWASPEAETVWQKLTDAGVDHINTDQLQRLKKFLLSQKNADSQSK